MLPNVFHCNKTTLKYNVEIIIELLKTKMYRSNFIDKQTIEKQTKKPNHSNY